MKKDKSNVSKDERGLAVHPNRSLRENLSDLPKACDWGAKYDSNGNKMT